MVKQALNSITPDLGIPWMNIIAGMVLLFIGIKMFSGGFKDYGDTEWLKWFMANPAFMFVGSIGCTLIWQSSSLTSAAIVGLVLSGALPLPSALAAILGANIGTTGTAWIAAWAGSSGHMHGPALHTAMFHTLANFMMGLMMLPWVGVIARFLTRHF